MQTVVMIGQLLLGLSILVFIHELGHFLAARMFGMRVDKFFIFFDFGKKKLFSFKRGDTEYGIGWFPLGGYVKISGMIDESMDKDQLAKEPEPWEFRSKPAWQRLIVMVAGVFMNLVLGILIFSLHTWHYGDKYAPLKDNNYGIVSYELGQQYGFQTGDKIIRINETDFEDLERFGDMFSHELLLSDNAKVTLERNGNDTTIALPPTFYNDLADAKISSFIAPRMKFIVGQIQPNSNAKRGGLLKDDKIIAINDQPVHYFDEFKSMLEDHEGEVISLKIIRNGEQMELPEMQVSDEGTLGFQVQEDAVFIEKHYKLGQSFVVGNQKAWNTLKEQTLGFKKLITGKADPRKALGGPIKIATIFGPVWDWYNFWFWCALLSLILAFMNLLPIPALDGGHVITILIEIVSGRALSTKTLEIIQTVGMVIVFSLIIFTVFNDIFQLLAH